MRYSLLVASVCSLLTVACSGGLSDDDTVVAWAATSTALAQGQSQAQLAANGTAVKVGPETSFRGLGVHPRASANVNYEWACTGGGTASYVGAAEAVVDEDGATNVTFDLAAQFDACSVSGTTISGDLDYAVKVETSAGMAYVMSTMKGSLSYEGQVDGSCDWNLTMKVATSSAGEGSVAAEFSGSVCGHEAKGLFKGQG